jgi:hypothetical protein
VSGHNSDVLQYQCHHFATEYCKSIEHHGSSMYTICLLCVNELLHSSSYVFCLPYVVNCTVYDQCIMSLLIELERTALVTDFSSVFLVCFVHSDIKNNISFYYIHVEGNIN